MLVMAAGVARWLGWWVGGGWLVRGGGYELVVWTG